MTGPGLKRRGKNCRAVLKAFSDKFNDIELLRNSTVEGPESTKMSNPISRAVNGRRRPRPGLLGKKSLTFKVDDL